MALSGSLILTTVAKPCILVNLDLDFFTRQKEFVEKMDFGQTNSPCVFVSTLTYQT